MMHRPRFHQLNRGQLVARGSYKWSSYPDCIAASVAEADFGTAPVVRQALHSAVESDFLGYVPKKRIDALVEEFVGFLGSRYGWQVEHRRVRVIPDVIKGLELAISHFSLPDSKVIVPTPAYLPFLTVPGMLGREVIQVPHQGDGDAATFDLDGIDRAFRAGGNLLILCNPHNPLGRVYTSDELLSLSRIVVSHHGIVFSDEVHAPLSYLGRRHTPYAALSESCAEHTVTATSASKAWNIPGVKCAQLIFHADPHEAAWERIGQLAEHGTSTLGVVANTAAYAAGAAWLDDFVRQLEQNRAALEMLMAEHVPTVRFHSPQATYLGWFDFSELDLPTSPGRFFVERAGVAMVDGVDFGVGYEKCARFNFAMPLALVTQAVRQMAAALLGESPSQQPGIDLAAR